MWLPQGLFHAKCSFYTITVMTVIAKLGGDGDGGGGEVVGSILTH